jgi:hypothetical protein
MANVRNKILSLVATTTMAFAVVAAAGGSASAYQPTATKCVKVKNVVGKNYQKAQDIWRAQGFTVLVAKDATGANRLAWLDSNWYVVGQTPKAGKCVKRGSGVRASIKKYTDN